MNVDLARGSNLQALGLNCGIGVANSGNIRISLGVDNHLSPSTNFSNSQLITTHGDRNVAGGKNLADIWARHLNRDRIGLPNPEVRRTNRHILENVGPDNVNRCSADEFIGASDAVGGN